MIIKSDSQLGSQGDVGREEQANFEVRGLGITSGDQARGPGRGPGQRRDPGIEERGSCPS